MRQRQAFTLLEVLLAMAIAVVVLGAVYSFVGYQLRQAHAGRDIIDRSTLARSVLARVDTDLRSAITLNDPGRYRMAAAKSAASGGSDTSGDTSAAGTTSGSTTTGASGTTATSGTTSGSTTGSSTTDSTSGSSTTAASGLTAITLPQGVMGTSTELHLFVSRASTEAFAGSTDEGPQLTSDLRHIYYWMSTNDKNGGLCRMESRVITSDQATTLDAPPGEADQYLYAREVKSIEFSYFDGTSWQSSWDSTTLGPDNATPQGSPRAIAVTLGLPRYKGTDQNGEIKYYRHVVHLVTANGTPTNNNPEGGTTAP
jgi:prepilin-type N-terminal cleavage/methylation domain-containing protein